MTRPTPRRDRPTKLRTNVAMLLVTACLAPLVTGCATGNDGRRTIRLINGKPEATRYVSPNAYQHYLEARLLIGRHDITGAIKHLRTALLFDEHSPLLYTELARLYQGRAAHKKARATLDKALAIQSDFPDALLIAGEFAEKEHPAEAIRAYRRCVTTDPAFPPCAQRLAKLYEGQDRSKEARAIWLNLVKHRPQDARAHAHFGDFCLRHLDLACAATHYAQALTRRAPLGLLLRIAQTERALGHFPQAAKILHEVFDRSDGS
ncbi:MAG: hypothetical protein KAI47_21420, partial [Deltaproteobacteria bacterium]|nr:hypothetical protein [Deltaproteobacteria bacterium]